MYGLAQHVAFKYPIVRRVLRVPVTPSESTTPLADMLEVAQHNWAAFWQDVREKNKISK